MSDINIEIRGPGGTFGYLTSLITREIERLGISVSVDDGYERDYGPDYKDVADDDIREQLRNRSVHIKVAHLPWGG